MNTAFVDGHVEGLRRADMEEAAVRRFFGVPQFHYYALADGIAFLLRRLTRWERTAEPRAPPDLQLSFPNL